MNEFEDDYEHYLLIHEEEFEQNYELRLKKKSQS